MELLKKTADSIVAKVLGKENDLVSQAVTQMELPIGREPSKDRNYDRGGRSFYFFDFDDNVAFLSTPIFVFHKENGSEIALSSGEFAQHHRQIGKAGPYVDYKFDYCDRRGSFRCFRDQDHSLVERFVGKKQMFIQDLAAALGFPDFQWKGPSWSCFYHATFNRRPTSLITARGHHPETIKAGIQLMVQGGHLPHEPNYLSVYPVTNPQIRRELGDVEMKQTVAALKKAAIRASVERAIAVYGANPFHRFGMSDDDPHNIELIVQAMSELKRTYPQMSFFVIETQKGHLVKWEIFPDRTEATLCAEQQQVGIFEQLSLLPS